MDKASAYGAGDCRFESCRGHFIVIITINVIIITIIIITIITIILPFIGPVAQWIRHRPT